MSEPSIERVTMAEGLSAAQAHCMLFPDAFSLVITNPGDEKVLQPEIKTEEGWKMTYGRDVFAWIKSPFGKSSRIAIMTQTKQGIYLQGMEPSFVFLANKEVTAELLHSARQQIGRRRGIPPEAQRICVLKDE